MDFEFIAKNTGFKVSTIEDLYNRGMLKGFLDMVESENRFKKEQIDLSRRINNKKSKRDRSSLIEDKKIISKLERKNTKSINDNKKIYEQVKDIKSAFDIDNNYFDVDKTALFKSVERVIYKPNSNNLFSYEKFLNDSKKPAYDYLLKTIKIIVYPKNTK